MLSTHKTLIEKISETELWTKLKPDIEKGEVFLSFRDKRIDFYSEGGKLFGFESHNGFKTHHKHLCVLPCNKTYISEDMFFKTHKVSFSYVYERIKENCSKFAQYESQVFAKNILKTYHYLSPHEICVLDIESSYQSFDLEKSQDRVDALIFDQTKKNLTFVEVKLYGNNELRAHKEPKVVKQIQKYQHQIKVRNADILHRYATYIKAVNQLFGINLVFPESMSPSVTLLITGFDQDQKRGGLKKMISNIQTYDQNIFIQSYGSLKSIKSLSDLIQK